MSKILKTSETTNVSDLLDILRGNLSALHVPEQDQLKLSQCIDIVNDIRHAHEREFERIARRLDNEICGDIIRTNPNSQSDVLDVGVDGIKTIVAQEMGL